MKKILTAAIILATCAALCTAERPQTGGTVGIPTSAVTSITSQVPTELREPQMVSLAQYGTLTELTEEEKPQEVLESPTPEEAPVEYALPVCTVQETAPSRTASQEVAVNSADPYHTDVYPENIYSEELRYDADGNLIGKTTTYPTAFGSDAIWINGRVYYNLPGFGLVEWGGPSSVTEDYIMCENGNKVGIMGGEGVVPAHSSTHTQSENMPESRGVVIDQTVNVTPERSSTPPDCKPDTTPPDDPNATVIP